VRPGVEQLRYRVHSSSQRVLDAIAAAASPGSSTGYSFSDRAKTQLIGGVHGDRFTLRRARGLMTAPRVLVLHGNVESSASGALVSATYRLHPLVQVARLAWLLFLVAVLAVVLPNAFSEPRLLWIIVVLGFVVGLMMVPFAWLARADRPVLRRELEGVLRQAGPIESELGRHDATNPANLE